MLAVVAGNFFCDSEVYLFPDVHFLSQHRNCVVYMYLPCPFPALCLSNLKEVV